MHIRTTPYALPGSRASGSRPASLVGGLLDSYRQADAETRHKAWMGGLMGAVPMLGAAENGLMFLFSGISNDSLGLCFLSMAGAMANGLGTSAIMGAAPGGVAAGIGLLAFSSLAGAVLFSQADMD